METPGEGIGAGEHRALARATNGRAWELLEGTRTPIEDLELVHVAHTSLWHWLQVGDAVNEQRGEWLVSHVYAVLRRSEPRSCTRGGAGTLRLPRSSPASISRTRAKRWRAPRPWAAMRSPRPNGVNAAASAAATITDPEDLQIFEDDFAGEPW